jgi:hypothetical protein
MRKDVEFTSDAFKPQGGHLEYSRRNVTKKQRLNKETTDKEIDKQSKETKRPGNQN